jgi:hypothetical protein
MKTIIALGNRQLGDRQFKHGEEVEPGLLTGELLDYWLDKKWAYEATERRSVYRLFHCFSGCEEREQLTPQELGQYALPD